MTFASSPGKYGDVAWTQIHVSSGKTNSFLGVLSLRQTSFAFNSLLYDAPFVRNRVKSTDFGEYTCIH
jgi:hypothetical protein